MDNNKAYNFSQKEIALSIMKDMYFNEDDSIGHFFRTTCPGYKKVFIEEFGTDDLRKVFYDSSSDEYVIS